MESLELRNKLIEQFNHVIQDDSKLAILDGIFVSITSTAADTLFSEAHYKRVEERRERWLSGETQGLSWTEVKRQLESKYGFYTQTDP